MNFLEGFGALVKLKEGAKLVAGMGAGEPTVGRMGEVIGDTVHFDIVDKAGNMVTATGLPEILAQRGMSMVAVSSGSTGSAILLAPKAPHFAATAKRVIHIFLNGGPSHVDTFDPKPALDKHHGKTLPYELRTERRTGTAFRSPYKFQKYGKSGIEVSELFAKTAESIDDICVIRSMHADVPNHEPSLMLLNCGDARLPRPSMGSWVTYGLGTENQNLPGYLTIAAPIGLGGAQNYGNAFLPATFQGTRMDAPANLSADKKNRKNDTGSSQAIGNLSNPQLTTAAQRAQLDLAGALNRRHAAARQDPALEARIHSFETAFRMQVEATDAFDWEREPAAIRELYGDTPQARQLLIARRLVERGVRFVQVWHGTLQPWDSHDNIEKSHRRLARECTQGITALLTDLKQRGLFEDTLLIWTTEFGRMPSTQGTTGRDHNPYVFTNWLCGGGIRGGITCGHSDEWGYKPLDRNHPTQVYDVHATILHLLGFDHTRLTWFHQGRDERLTDVFGNVVTGILA